jgi:hypothetical protein
LQRLRRGVRVQDVGDGMSGSASQFATMARVGTISYPRVTFGGQATIMKLCQECGQQMPHVVGAKVCILCDGDEQPATKREDDDSG